MHKRAAQLVLAATELRRELWQSLPLQIQVRELLIKLASSETDNWAAGIYQLFAQHGIKGTGIDDPTRPVRSGPGQGFGSKVFSALLVKVNNRHDLARDIMQEFYTSFLEKGHKSLDPNYSLHQAENYVMRGVINRALNRFRKKTEKSVETKDDDGESVSMYDRTPTEQDSSPKLDLRRLPSAVRAKINHIYPDAELYLKLSLQGYTDREILGDLSDPHDKNSPIKPETSLLKHPYNNNGEPLKEKTWSRIKGKIMDALNEYADGDADNLFEG